MPYTVPTTEQFLARFPVFNSRDEDQIAAILVEASGFVDATWEEKDYQPAIMYMAAHLLTTDSSQEGDDAGSGGDGVVASESFGGMSVSYVRPTGTSGNSFTNEWATTSYGRRYLALLKMNKPAVVPI